MKLALRRIVAPLILLTALWVLVTILGDGVAKATLGVFDAERMVPYSNAHLLEEAAEGLYTPISDPVFLLYIIAVGIVAFGGSSLFAGWAAPKEHLSLAAIPAIIGISIIISPRLEVWSGGYPDAMQYALLVESFLYVSCALLGLLGSAVWFNKSGRSDRASF